MFTNSNNTHLINLTYLDEWVLTVLKRQLKIQTAALELMIQPKFLLIINNFPFTTRYVICESHRNFLLSLSLFRKVTFSLRSLWFQFQLKGKDRKHNAPKV